MSIEVKVDPCNPGQFFACCGLLELADRLWPGAEGCFEDGGRTFRITQGTDSQGPMPSESELLQAMARVGITNTMSPEQLGRLTELSKMKEKERKKDEAVVLEKKALDSLRRESPIRVRLEGRPPFVVDWFLDKSAGGSRFKTWAGQQSVIDIIGGMHRPIFQGKWAGLPATNWLSKSISGDDLPFYFDSGLSGQGSALDAGFSFDPLGFKMPVRPFLEMAAFVGLQRFRPTQVGKENLFRFELWTTPLNVTVAPAAACGGLATAGNAQYEFRLLYRTDYLKSFLPSQPVRGDA